MGNYPTLEDLDMQQAVAQLQNGRLSINPELVKIGCTEFSNVLLPVLDSVLVLLPKK